MLLGVEEAPTDCVRHVPASAGGCGTPRDCKGLRVCGTPSESCAVLHSLVLPWLSADCVLAGIRSALLLRRGATQLPTRPASLHLPTPPSIHLPYYTNPGRTEKMGTKVMRYPATYPEILTGGENGGWVALRAVLDKQLYDRMRQNPSFL